MTYRESCGTLQGILFHQASGEPLCGFCAGAEQVARVTAEGIPERPPARSDALAPVTARQASVNRSILATALGIGEEHPPVAAVRDGDDELAFRRAVRDRAAG